MSIRPASAFEITRLIELQPDGETGFCVVIEPEGQSTLLSELEEELASQDGGTLTVINAKERDVEGLLNDLRQAESTVIILHGLEGWINGQFAALDINRSRMETGAFHVLKSDIQTVGRFFEHAPNLRSFVGTNVFLAAQDLALMGLQEITDRLDQLRRHHRLTDEQVLDRVRNGSLPADPDFAEWLVLLGSNEFVR